jgi:hypothetical protein
LIGNFLGFGQTSDSPVSAFLGIVNDHDQVARGEIARGAASEYQTSHALANHFVTITVAAEVKRDPGLAGHICALIGRLTDQIGHLLHAHPDLQLCESAARSRFAGNFAFPVVVIPLTF